MKKTKPKPRKPWKQCSRCENGLLIEKRRGRNVAVRCECWKQWKRDADKPATNRQESEVA